MEHQTEPEQNKAIGIIAYLTLIGLIVAFILNMEKKEAFGNFHIRQALGIVISGVALSFIMVVPFIGWALAMVGYLLVFVMWVFGIINAISGNMKPVPVLGDKFDEWFQGIK